MSAELGEGEREQSVSNEAVKPNGHAAEFTGLHATWGAPEATYEYRDAQGDLLFVTCRYTLPDGSEELCPWSYNGTAWVSRAPAAPRTLYGLELLSSNPGSSVLLVECEASAAAARRVLRPDGNITLSWFGGLEGVASTDLAPLSSRRVNIWPAANEPGWRAAGRLGAMLYALNAEVAVIDTHGQADGWSLASAIQQGMGSRELLAYAKAHKKPIGSSAQAAQMAIPVKPARVMPVSRLDTQEAHDEMPEGLSHTEIWEHYGLECVKGLPWANLDNAIRVVSKHPQLSKDLWFDEFRQLMMRRDAPWDDEDDTLKLTAWMQRAVKLHKVNKHIVYDAVRSYARSKARHPIREHLNALTWDGMRRLESWLQCCFGAADSPYMSSVGRIFLISMIARVFDPGCLVRTMPILEGAQEAGKTTALRIIGAQWHSEVSESMATKDFLQSLTGRWLVEVSELESFGRTSMERIKSTVSNPSDWFRESYGRRAVEHPRQCVLVGTTNADQYFEDETGGTRFLPIKCTRVDLDWLRANRDGLLAEALARFRAGEDWYKLERVEAAQIVGARYIADPWEQHIATWIFGRKEITISELLSSLEIDMADRDKNQSRRVGRVLRHLGWEPKNERRDGQVVPVFRPSAVPSG